MHFPFFFLATFRRVGGGFERLRLPALGFRRMALADIGQQQREGSKIGGDPLCRQHGSEVRAACVGWGGEFFLQMLDGVAGILVHGVAM